MRLLGWKLVIAFVSLVAFLGSSPKTSAQTWSNSYTFRRPITIDHTKVPNTDQTNFPVLLSGTYSYLATTANGGNVTNSSGFDIIFTSDSAGTLTLSYEREAYSATTGAATLWVKVPTVSHTADTIIYMFYGNSAVTTDQSSKTAVWDSNYVGVFHLSDNAANTTVGDSTSNADNGVAAANTNTKTGAGEIASALTFNGTSDSISVPQNGKFNLHASPFTISGWMRDDSSAIVLDAKHRAVSWYDGTKNMQLGFGSAGNDLNRIVYLFVGTSASSTIAASTGNLATGFHHVVTTFDGTSTIHIYVDGVNVDGGTWDGSVTAYSADSTTLYLGQRGGGASFVNGQLDEMRISKSVRSADWTLTEFRNQSSPATFYSIGAASTQGGGSGGYSFNRTITIDHTKVPNTDQSNFPLLVSGTYSYLATTANGGNVTSSNGFDIVFASDAAGTLPLSFEREAYSATTGQVTFWVKVPTVSHTTDTVIYMLYGNSAVTTDQSNKSAVWDGNYVGVFHLSDNAANTTVLDSTSNADNGTAAANTNTKTGAGKVASALTFNGTSDSIAVPQNGHFILHAIPFTISGWMRDDSSAVVLDAKHRAVSWYDGTKNMQLGFGSAGNDVNRIVYLFIGTTAASTMAASTGNLSTGFHHVVCTFDGTSTIHIYVDGTNLDGGTWDGSVTAYSADSTTLYLGQRGGGASFLNGQLDEMRISKIVRSADWTLAEYRNQNSPSTFYSVGAGSGGGGSAPTVTGFSPTSGAAGTSVTITGTNFTGATAVKFGTTTAAFTVNSATQIAATVPSLAAGCYTISVTTSAGTGNSSTCFTVPSPPTITGFSPGSGTVGTSVTITGTNFTGATAVKFNGFISSFTVNSATQIAATVPSSATTGPISVTTPAGTATSSTNFTVTGPAPSITAVSPGSGRPLAFVTITGTNFGSVPVSVKFGTTSAPINAWSDTSIVVQVPGTLAPTTLNVVVNSATGTSNAVSFTVIGPGCF
jgi:hypothetical protein